jgi:hypothetical protein
MLTVLSVFLCLTTGYLVVALAWARRGPRWADFLLRASLSAGYGIGICSVTYCIALAGGFSLLALDLFALALPLFLLSWRRKPGIAAGDLTTSHTCTLWPLWLRRTVTASFLLALSAAIYSAIRLAISHPHGDGWDAFAIWNLHARFLFRSGAHWRDGFSALIPWSHPDHPLLLQASIARLWTYLGGENQAVPAILGLVFGFNTVALLCASLAALRGSTAAMLGGLTLLSTPFFVEHSTAQFADVPLSFYVLAAIALVALYDRLAEANAAPANGILVLAGSAAGLAAWTKNEGLLFALAIVFVRALHTLRHHRPWRPLLVLAISLAPAMLLIAGFKRFIAPPATEPFADQNSLHKLALASRYRVILEWYGKEFLRFGEWAFIPGTLLLAGLYYATRITSRQRNKPEAGFLIFVPLLALAAYFIVYLITPSDLFWRLRFSLNRLFLQLWPGAIFLFFLAFAPAQRRIRL